MRLTRAKIMKRLDGEKVAMHRMIDHTLKTDPSAFSASKEGKKPWEIRLNDRDFKVGDYICLRETLRSGRRMAAGDPLVYTGRTLVGAITHVMGGPVYGLADGWVIFTVDYEQ